MTRHDAVEIPPLNLPHTPIEPRPVPRARHIPIKPLLPNRTPLRTHQADKHPRQQAGRGRFPRARILLVRRQVEQQVGLDEGAVGPVVEDELPVGVRVHVLVLEVGVEVRVDVEGVFVRGREDVLEARAGGGFVALCAFLGEAFGAQEGGGREGRRPFRQEDVVFEVWRDQVFDAAAEGGERFAHGGR